MVKTLTGKKERFSRKKVHSLLDSLGEKVLGDGNYRVSVHSGDDGVMITLMDSRPRTHIFDRLVCSLNYASSSKELHVRPHYISTKHRKNLKHSLNRLAERTGRTVYFSPDYATNNL